MIDKFVVIKRRRDSKTEFKPVSVVLTQSKAIQAAIELPPDDEYGLAEVLKTEVVYTRPLKTPAPKPHREPHKAHKTAPKRK